MPLLTILILFTAGVIAGALNSVAGGGSFIGFPAILYAGVPEIQANATNSVALWPGALSSVFAYRKDLNTHRRTVIVFSLIALVGGALGALILLNTPRQVFVALLPYLMLGATLLFAFGGAITARLRGNRPVAATLSWGALLGFGLGQLLIALYGGFFGGGQGIMMLALYTMMGMDDIHAMNGLKALMASLINGASVVVFTLRGAVYWPEAVVVMAGAMTGGYLGARYAKKIPTHYLRWFVIAVGTTLTIYFFARAR